MAHMVLHNNINVVDVKATRCNICSNKNFALFLISSASKSVNAAQTISLVHVTVQHCEGGVVEVAEHFDV
jgi:hypothetical protein